MLLIFEPNVSDTPSRPSAYNSAESAANAATISATLDVSLDGKVLQRWKITEKCTLHYCKARRLLCRRSWRL